MQKAARLKTGCLLSGDGSITQYYMSWWRLSWIHLSGLKCIIAPLCSESICRVRALHEIIMVSNLWNQMVLWRHVVSRRYICVQKRSLFHQKNYLISRFFIWEIRSRAALFWLQNEWISCKVRNSVLPFVGQDPTEK